jgi:hypothetical protein
MQAGVAAVASARYVQEGVSVGRWRRLAVTANSSFPARSQPDQRRLAPAAVELELAPARRN